MQESLQMFIHEDDTSFSPIFQGRNEPSKHGQEDLVGKWSYKTFDINLPVDLCSSSTGALQPRFTYPQKMLDQMPRGPTHSRAIFKVRSGCSGICQLNFENFWGWRCPWTPSPRVQALSLWFFFSLQPADISLAPPPDCCLSPFFHTPVRGAWLRLPSTHPLGGWRPQFHSLGLLFSRWNKSRPLHISLHATCSGMHTAAPLIMLAARTLVGFGAGLCCPSRWEGHT